MTAIGESLRQARLQRGLDLEQAAAAINLRARYLADLEAERFDRLPAPVYARSFLREYADELGLDAQLLVALYDADQREANIRPEIVARATVRRRRGAPPWRRMAIPVALALAVLGVWMLGAGGSPPPQLGISTPRPHAAPSAKAAVLPALHRSTRARPAVAVLTAGRGDCWLSVRIGSRDGRVVHEGFVRAGKTLRLGLRQPLWIRLGAPWNVDVRVAGKRISLPSTGRPLNVLASSRGIQPAS